MILHRLPCFSLSNTQREVIYICGGDVSRGDRLFVVLRRHDRIICPFGRQRLPDEIFRHLNGQLLEDRLFFPVRIFDRELVGNITIRNCDVVEVLLRLAALWGG